MQITLYQNSSEKNKIGKVLTSVGVLTGTLRGEASIIHPEILIEYSDPTAFNYCYIDTFTRYYYVDDVVVVRAGLLRLILSVDVLETYKTAILAQNVVASRSESSPNFYLPDENWKVNAKTKTDIVNFPQGFSDNGEFILITAGGGVTP